jgi:hypothetical protein
MNEYEVYADRHFLRTGDPVEPAEFRAVDLPLRAGTLLTKSAWADLDSFPMSTLEPYRSIVTRPSPAESRPPSTYEPIWRGRYYELWQRPAVPSRHILEHIPLGESNARPYCGNAQNAQVAPLCSIDAVAVPPCAQIRTLGAHALADHAELVAYQRPEPIAIHGDESLWPRTWFHDSEARTLTPAAPGLAVSHIAIASNQIYQLWLNGNFARGFEVSVDGRSVGRLKDKFGYQHVADVFLTRGVHTFVFTYPHSDLTPGSGENEFTSLAAIALVPQSPASELITVAPQQATSLCGRPLDWIEIVAPGA